MKVDGISIVIPAYNEEKFLPATLLTVNAACEATEIPTEVIVVNNASTDRTEETALAYDATVVQHNVRNISAVRNAGINSATYDLVVMIDADCFLPVHGLTEIAHAMVDQNLVGGSLRVKVITERWVIKIMAPIIQALVYKISGITGAMFFFSRRSALAIGGFREDRLVAEDSAFALALSAHGKKEGKKFIYLRSVCVGTLDRKEVSVRIFFKVVPQVIFAFLGKKQRPEDLKYWYEPKR